MFLEASPPTEDPGFQQYRFDLEGSLDVARLREAWERVTARHDVLRTRFIVENGAPLAVVQRRVELPWRVEDWRGEAVADARLETLLRDERARGLEVTRAPPARRWGAWLRGDAGAADARHARAHGGRAMDDGVDAASSPARPVVVAA